MSEKNNDKISELKEQINTINITDDLIKIAGLKRIECLEEVLRDHLNSHIKVAREQLTEKDKMTVFREFDDAIVNQLKKLGAKAKDGDSETLKEIKKLAKEESEFYNKHGYFSFWSDKLKAQRIKEQNDGEKSVIREVEFENKGFIIKDNINEQSKDCLYWEEGHDIMNCRDCTTPNKEYCKKFYDKKEKPPEPPLKSELDDMANITQIIEIYDNGHENVFYPNTHIIVEKADLKKIYRKLRRSIHAHTTLDNLELSVIDTLKLIKNLLGGDLNNK